MRNTAYTERHQSIIVSEKKYKIYRITHSHYSELPEGGESIVNSNHQRRYHQVGVCYCATPKKVKTYLGDITGSVPDNCNRASQMNFLHMFILYHSLLSM